MPEIQSTQKPPRPYTPAQQRRDRTIAQWQAMIDKCYCRAEPQYPYIGGKGIRPTRRWRGGSCHYQPVGVDNLIADMGFCPPGCILWRIDRTKNYSKTNCLWKTRGGNLTREDIAKRRAELKAQRRA